MYAAKYPLAIAAVIVAVNARFIPLRFSFIPRFSPAREGWERIHPTGRLSTGERCRRPSLKVIWSQRRGQGNLRA